MAAILEILAWKELSIWKTAPTNPIKIGETMMSGVSRNSHNLKIFNSIIGWNPIDMMDNFIIFKISTNFFFHNKSVLKNIAGHMTIWMIRSKHAKIFSYLRYSAFPPKIVFASNPCASKSISAFVRTNWVLPSFEVGWTTVKDFLAQKTKGFHRFWSHGHYYKSKSQNCQHGLPEVFVGEEARV